MIKHTTNPAERAADIADRETDRLFIPPSGDWKKDMHAEIQVWHNIYQQVLFELCYNSNPLGE